MSDAPTEALVNPAETGVEADDTDATSIVVIGLVSTALVLASGLGVTALYDWYKNKLSADRVVGAVYSDAKTALAEQENRLSGSPKIVDETAGTYSVPIDVAMQLVLKEVRAEQGSGATP